MLLGEKRIGEFSVTATDAAARRGVLQTAHGVVDTPNFMPVGTQGTVKGLCPRVLKEIGAQIVLSNAYHLHLRPGDEVIRDLGGLHRFMGWDRAILTDSGGYQVFSLAGLRQITEDGVTFQSHLDGQRIHFTPERVVQIQENLGVDIMMVLDECPSLKVAKKEISTSLQRTLRWAERSVVAKSSKENSLFAIVQGGMYPDLRAEAVEKLMQLPFDGYAIGGVSVGEPKPQMRSITESTALLLPASKPRYLMGVGTPRDILHAVSQGIDLFDCVIPTRSARFGRIYLGNGQINMRNSEYRQDSRVLDEECDCYTCRNFSRAYLAHLVHAGEVLWIELATLHNVRFYERLMENIRNAIECGSLASLLRKFEGAVEE